SRATPSGMILGRRWSVPTSAVMPMFVSCTTKNASSVAYRMSHAVTRSTAPPTQPPWIAARTGIRARSIAVNDSWSRRTISCRLGWPRRAPPAPPAPPPAVKTLRSMPALKCFPVDDSTTARTPPSSLSRPISAGSSDQNSGTIEFSSSGRHSRTWATLDSTSTSKQRMRTFLHRWSADSTLAEIVVFGRGATGSSAIRDESGKCAPDEYQDAESAEERAVRTGEVELRGGGWGSAVGRAYGGLRGGRRRRGAGGRGGGSRGEPAGQ